MTLLLLYINKNPSIYQNNDGNKQSIVTYNNLGKRGDMGNQLFQLACVIAAANRSNAKIVLPTSVLSLPLAKLFNMDQFEVKDLIPDAIYHEYDNYENIIIPKDGRIYNISGYRQAYKYFDDQSATVRKLLTPKIELINSVKNIVPSKYIAVHIRKGDYVKLIHKVPLLREFRRCQLQYYREGIKKLREYYHDYPLLVCTDSPKLITPILSELDNKAILAPSINNISPKFTDFIILYLANGLVMSNSTYSWMSSYLNPYKTVVCPTPWWDPDGFIGTSMGLNGPYMHYPEWWLLDADNGAIIREPYSNYGEKADNNHETLNIFRLVRGLLL